MSSFDDCAKSFFARLRALFGRRSHALAVGVFLLLSPVPIRPEEIEEHMHCMSKAKWFKSSSVINSLPEIHPAKTKSVCQASWNIHIRIHSPDGRPEYTDLLDKLRTETWEVQKYDIGVDDITVRLAKAIDLTELAAMRNCLWPETSPEEHARELAPVLIGQAPGSFPATLLVAEASDGKVIGLIEVRLRSHADGCDPAHPVGFIEGWYVTPGYRRQKVGTRLVVAAEQWARAQGCNEMASDTWIDELDSQRAHEALGFEVVDRCVHYRKGL